MTEPNYRLGVDIGGTFTDLSLLDLDTHRIFTHKVSSTPKSPSAAVRRGTSELMQRLGASPAHIAGFVHGTTIALNATIERRGAVVALFVTRGTRDILEIGRLAKENSFNLRAPGTEPLVPRRHVVELPGRIGSDGRILEDLADADIDAALDGLRDAGIESCAVCLLNAHVDPVHELRVQARVQQRLPNVHCSRSTELWPEIREYERATVACLNAYVQPVMSRYVAQLQRDAAEIGLKARLYITRSNGGVMSAAAASGTPVHTMLSGPASGVVGAAYLARLAGVADAVTCDIGGTSADVSLVRAGEAVHSTEAKVGSLPLVMPSVDVFAVGAGGGSIAWFDALGVLKVGPRSAGASPGPACYGLGGTEATVTDAYVVCGYVNPDNFVGGTVKLDRGLAEAAVGRVAERLGVSLDEAAQSMLAIASANMVTALLPMMTKRGIDPRDFTLIPFGGAGATHACLLAEELMIPRVLIPPSPGTLCALGAMIADIRADYIRSVQRGLEVVGAPAIAGIFAELEAQAQQWLAGEEADIERVELQRSADMRYVGQAFDIEVDLTPAPGADGMPQALGSDEIAARFHETYKRLYEISEPGAPLQLVNLRVRIAGKSRVPELRPTARAAPGSAPSSIGERSIRYGGRRHLARVYRRDDLLAGHQVVGPAVIEQFDTTTVVAPGFVSVTDERGILMMSQQAH